MSSFLPREWGESGTLRVSDIQSTAPAHKRNGLRSEAQKWLQEQSGTDLINLAARELRQKNLDKAATCRHVRQSRVS